MELISPNMYIESKKIYSIDELEKEKLIADIENIINNVHDVFNGDRYTKLKMYESCLKELEKLMESKKCL